MNVVKGKIIPLNDSVIVSDMHFDEIVTSTGIIIKSDDGKSEGVKPRWGKVWAIGPRQTDVKVGEWILIEHGRWTRGVTVQDEDGNQTIIRRVEVKSILASADDRPSDIMFGSHSSTEQGQVFRPEMFAGPQF
jgi:co-chaperonin GroES (HSP10)